MLSRKNKDTRTIKDGVVGKYVKKDKPPEIPIINVWGTEPFRKNNNSRTNVSEAPSSSNLNQPGDSAQKFGNVKNSPSPSSLIGHEGKYTPSSSVPDLAQKFANANLWRSTPGIAIDQSSINARNFNNQYIISNVCHVNHQIGAHANANCVPYHTHSDLDGSSVIMHRYDNSANAVYTPAISQYIQLQHKSDIINTHHSAPAIHNIEQSASVTIQSEKEGLPTGWERIESNEYGVYFVNHITQQAQYEHPCAPHYIYQPEVRISLPLPPPPPPRPHFHPHNMLVPASPYLNQEIPVWLSVYSQAAPTLDHKLRWEMFRLTELDCYNAMLTRIYKQQLEEIVMRYEFYRSRLLTEIDKRRRCIKQNECNHQKLEPRIIELSNDHLREAALSQPTETKV